MSAPITLPPHHPITRATVSRAKLVTTARGEGMAADEFAFLDPRFRKCINSTARVYRLFEGCAWSPGWRSLVWSDIPNDRQLRWDESSGTVGVFRHPAGYTNGNTVDRQGRLLSCEHGGRRVSRTEFDGTVITIA